MRRNLHVLLNLPEDVELRLIERKLAGGIPIEDASCDGDLADY